MKIQRLKDRGRYERKHLIIPLDEFKSQFGNSQYLKEKFTAGELKEFPFDKNANSLAGRYIVKKLILDYLKTGDDFRQIEILNDDFGKPVITFSDNITNICEQKSIRSICCSISHSRKRVTGMIVIDH